MGICKYFIKELAWVFKKSLTEAQNIGYPYRLGSGRVPVGSPVFKTGGGPRCGPQWVRPPSTPACDLVLWGNISILIPHSYEGLIFPDNLPVSLCIQ
jgi:hypothetical protein